jgi:hypothetical protein
MEEKQANAQDANAKDGYVCVRKYHLCFHFWELITCFAAYWLILLAFKLEKGISHFLHEGNANILR